jgi:hypothetical protein
MQVEPREIDGVILFKPGLFGHDFDLKQVDYSTSTQELCEAFTTPMFGQAKCDLSWGRDPRLGVCGPVRESPS